MSPDQIGNSNLFNIISDTIQQVNEIVNSNSVQSTSQSISSGSNTGYAIAVVGLLVFAAHLFAAIFSKRRIPDVLFLIIIGILIGPLFHWVTPDMLGSAGGVFTSLTLIIILFESGTELNFKVLSKSLRSTARLTLISFFITFGVVGLSGWLALGFDPILSFTLGAVLGGTSSAIIIPMVQHVDISKKSSTILILESAFNDVLCIVIALALLKSIKLGQLQFGILFGDIFSSFVLAILIGFLGAIVWAFVLDKVRLIKNSIFSTPAFVFIIYGANEILGYSGAISALAFGIGLANIDVIYNRGLNKFITKQPSMLNETEKTLFSEMVFLMKTFFFVYIGISIKFNNLQYLLIGLVLTIIIFIFRILAVKLSFIKNHESPASTDKAYMSAMNAKGLAAAVVTTIIEGTHLPGTENIGTIVYSVILFSIVFTSVLVPMIGKKKGIYKFYAWIFGGLEQINSSDSVVIEEKNEEVK